MTRFLSGLMTAAMVAGLTMVSGTDAQAEQLANRLFAAKKSPSAELATPVGTYARGCSAGAVALPETGPTWQAMRLSRNRNYGQPELVQYLMDLSRRATQIGWRGLYIGDMGQPRGGPMSSGHASHQIGLDADVWMLPPQSLTLSRAQREKISSISVRSADQRTVTRNWTPSHAALLKVAASDPRVDRIFVAAAVKVEMCKTAKRSDRDWLQKIRPYYGHNTHFHVRLKCPRGASFCKTQTPTVAQLSKGGDGCDATLQWWVTDLLNPPKKGTGVPKKAAPAKRGPRQFTMADLPQRCADVLSAP